MALLTRCFAGAGPEGDGQLSDGEVTRFLNVREDLELVVVGERLGSVVA